MNQIEQTSVLKVAGPAAGEAITRAVARGSSGYSLSATLWLLMRDEDVEKFTLTASGTVPASAE